MRKFTAGNGSDATATVQAYLASARNIYYLADLFMIGELDDPNPVLITNYSSPLSWPIWGKFLPSQIQRGKITSQFGLKVDTFDFTWSPPKGTFTNNINTTSPYQLAQIGFYDNKTFRMWRCVMPTPGDANTYGATPYFGGRIGSCEITRAGIKFTVNSFLDVVNQMVPANVIENTNTRSAYVGATPAPGDQVLATFKVVAGSTTTVILADCLGPTPGNIYADNTFTGGYLVFLGGAGNTLAGFWSAIAFNGNFNAGGGIHHSQFDIYTPLPWAPTPTSDTFYVSKQSPIDLTDGSFFGFPYVPAPETEV